MTERDMLIDQLTEVNELAQEVLRLGKLGADLNFYIFNEVGITSDFVGSGCNKVKSYKKYYSNKSFLKSYYEHVVNENIKRENSKRGLRDYEKRTEMPSVKNIKEPTEIKPKERPSDKPKVKISWSAWAGVLGGLAICALAVLVIIFSINLIKNNNTTGAATLLFFGGGLIPIFILYYKKILGSGSKSKQALRSIRKDFEIYKQELFLYNHYDEYLAQVEEKNKAALDSYNKAVEKCKKDLESWRSDNKQAIKEVEDQYNEFFEKWDELPNLMIRILDADDLINSAYLSRLPKIINLLELGRADTVKEALNMCLARETRDEAFSESLVHKYKFDPYFASYREELLKHYGS